MQPPTIKIAKVNYSVELKEWKLKNSVLYGPFKTRRRGMSLGINLLPEGKKICNFNCLYCQCGWSYIKPTETKKFKYPDIEQISIEMERGFAELKQKNIIPDNIVLSGNGEPTLYPDFLDATKKLVECRDKFFPGVKISILSNGARIDEDEVVEGVNILDERDMKLDAGSEKVFKKLDLPDRNFSLKEYIKNLRRLKDVTIQTCFVKGIVDNTTDEEIEEWLTKLRVIKPIEVQIYSLDRVPASDKVFKVDRKKLETIAELVINELNIKAEVF